MSEKKDSSRPPSIDFEQLAGKKTPGYLSPGARKEKLRNRAITRRARPHSRPYPELHTASAFSFLDGASLPEDLVQRAAELDLPAVALLDRNGVYGAPRFYKAAQQAGIKAIVGAEVVVDLNELQKLEERCLGPEVSPGGQSTHPVQSGVSNRGTLSRRTTPQTTPNDQTSRGWTSETPLHERTARLSLLVGSRVGYKNLCRLLTAAARDRPKGEARVDWRMLEQYAAGLHCITGGDESPLALQLETAGFETAQRLLKRLTGLFSGRLHVEVQRHNLRQEEHRNRALLDLANRLRLPLIATNGVRYAHSADKALHDILNCIKHHTHLDAAGRLLMAHRERHFKPAAAMESLFADLPAALAGSRDLAERLDFTLADLGYRFPDYPLPPSETPISYLRHVTWNGARSRFQPLTARAQAQIEQELAMIEKLELAGYFLIVWDIVRFCQRENILVQGRGSAANSAVCYALSITAVDPVKMELLFERFLSEERGEWPDIDLDLPSGDQREKVIQYVYQRYGPHGAAMTANVITYRDRSAAREVAKTLGYSAEQVDKLAKQFGRWHYDVSRGDSKSLSQELTTAGFSPDDPRIQLFTKMWRRIQNLPRHLGQHSGGMVIAAGRLDEVVPIEPAAMEGRVVVQWDKDDCADLGIIKVDLLGLGMLQALEEAIPLIRTHEGVEVDLAHLPPEDPKTFEMLRRADTVGVFQVESRAQMASLPRNAPTRFYDLVIQVAIIRPGPIVGGMVHPYFERRRGRQKVTYPHPSLEPILKRTLGVLLFQEQILRVAMVAAGFTGGEAEDLRRAMGFKRSAERMQKIDQKLRTGMSARGITGKAQEQIVQAITSFALYGFPESHAASFALIAYSSAYLKAHHPTAFVIALLNAWPMGFYHPATLVKDAQRHGVEVRPIDVNFSGWKCRWEEREDIGRMPKGSWTSTAGASSGGSRSKPRGKVSKAGNIPKSSGSRPAEQAPAVRDARALNHHLSPRVSERRGQPREPRAAQGIVRLGLRYIKGLRHEAGEAIEREQALGAFKSIDDLFKRCRLRREELDRLSEAGALASLGLTRRAALWQSAKASKPAGPLYEERPLETVPPATTEKAVQDLGFDPRDLIPPSEAQVTRENAPGLVPRTARSHPAGRGTRPQESFPLPEMTPFQETLADYSGTGLTAGPHPMEHLRSDLDRHRIIPAAHLDRVAHGERVRTAGSVIVRQRPGTAKGILFLTLEDETGMSQAIISPDLLQKYRRLVVGTPGLVVEGILQKRDGTFSVKAEKFWKLSDLVTAPSHDFR